MSTEVITPFYQHPEFWVDALLALFTGLLFGATYLMVRRGKADSERQSREMQDSIAAAVRSAKAMETVAENGAKGAAAAVQSVQTLKERTARQLRAYLTVNVGSGLFQDRHANVKFAVLPSLLNSGQTPAHNVRYRSKAEILDAPLDPDFSFPLGFPDSGAALLGPHQSMTLNAGLVDFVDDELAENVKYARGNRRLYIWGEVKYEDVFGETHHTQFCHHIFWIQDSKDPQTYTVHGFYEDRHNQAD